MALAAVAKRGSLGPEKPSTLAASQFKTSKTAVEVDPGDFIGVQSCSRGFLGSWVWDGLGGFGLVVFFVGLFGLFHSPEVLSLEFPENVAKHE